MDVAGNEKADRAAKEAATRADVGGDEDECDEFLPEHLGKGISVNPTASNKLTRRS